MNPQKLNGSVLSEQTKQPSENSSLFIEIQEVWKA
jgi:hypothetical protein